MKNTYEERLLTELRQIVAENATPGPARRFGWKPRLVVGGVAAALIAVGAVAVIETTATPAFAVDKNNDGSVSVTINKLSDAEGLQRQLIAAGVPTVAKYLPLGKKCSDDWYRPAPSGSMYTSMRIDQDHVTFTIGRYQLGKGQTLVISTEGGVAPGPNGKPADVSGIGLGIAQGPVGVCHVVDIKVPPPGQSGAGGGAVRVDGNGSGSTPLK
ncbi:hypothetical protein GCM10009765_64840 [Fodinicola feengrottensis]|uniref:Anti-sigma factor n=1 Tax=Fodinicola feengrottensis TaxID=435914 RepID=A0ABP4UJS1_9ACTN